MPISVSAAAATGPRQIAASAQGQVAGVDVSTGSGNLASFTIVTAAEIEYVQFSLGPPEVSQGQLQTFFVQVENDVVAQDQRDSSR